MASSLVIARAAAGLPSFRVPALSGQGAAVLAGRRDVAGRGGVLAVRRDGAGRGGVLAVRRDGAGRCGVLAVGFFQVQFPRPVCAVKATGGQSEPSVEDADTEFELVRQLKEERDRRMTGTYQFVFGVMHDEEDFLRKEDQVTVTDYATSSFELWAVVANRLRPSTESMEYQGLKRCGETIVGAAVSCDKGRGTWKTVSDMVEALDLLRRLAASTLEAPMPLDSGAGLRPGLQRGMGLLFTLRRTFVLVERDVDCMIGSN